MCLFPFERRPQIYCLFSLYAVYNQTPFFAGFFARAHIEVATHFISIECNPTRAEAANTLPRLLLRGFQNIETRLQQTC